MNTNFAVWTIAAVIYLSSPSIGSAEPNPDSDQDAIDQIIDNDDHEVGEEMCAWPAFWQRLP